MPSSALHLLRAPFALFWAVLLGSTSAQAASQQPQGMGLDVLAGTRFPLSIGVQAQAEGPGRLQAGLGLGLLPGFYVDTINEVAMALDAYDQPTADVIRSTIQSSLLCDVDLGWRPFRRAGFLFGVGYSLATLGGSATAQDILAAASGLEPPDASISIGPVGFGTDDAILEYDASATLHMLRVDLAWRWPLGQRYVLKIGLGGAFTLAARSHIEPAYDPLVPSLLDAFTSESEAWLDDTLEAYVHSPTLTLQFGSRLVGASGTSLR